jgi:hypothetical protein
MRKERGNHMIQWIGVVLTVIGLAYTGLKDYQKGDIQIPDIKKHLTPVKYPVQYCLMAYDPNVDKVFYLHENGIWHDYAPEQRRYSPTTQPQQNQGQGQKALGSFYGTQGTSGYRYGQSPQASTHSQRY